MEKHSSLDKIVTSIALLCVGICFIVWADQVTNWIAILFGIIALVYATIAFIKFVKTSPEQRTTLPLFYIILSAAAGILLISRANFIKEAISFIVGVYIILTCSVQLLNISGLRRETKEKVGSYLWPVIGIVVGALCVSGQFIIPNELARLTGAGLIIYAIVYLAGFITIRTVTKNAQKQVDKALGIKEGEIVKDAKSKEKKPSQSHSK